MNTNAQALPYNSLDTLLKSNTVRSVFQNITEGDEVLLHACVYVYISQRGKHNCKGKENLAVTRGKL